MTQIPDEPESERSRARELDSIQPRIYREALAEKLFTVTILEASDNKIWPDPEHTKKFAKFWAGQCFLMADGFIEALIAEREQENEWG